MFQDSLNLFAVDSLPWFSAAPLRDSKTQKIENRSPAEGGRSTEPTDVMALWVKKWNPNSNGETIGKPQENCG